MLFEKIQSNLFINFLNEYQGHSPAGGCLLAISCDYRVMVGGKSKIGLNETLLGIVAPFWLVYFNTEFKENIIKSLWNHVGSRMPCLMS